jgi:hypothetical protein
MRELLRDVLEKFLGVGRLENLKSLVRQRRREHFTHQQVVFEDRDPHRALRESMSPPVHDCFIHCVDIFVKLMIRSLCRHSRVVLLNRE